MLGKLLAGKALAAVAVLGLTATGAAAGTGSLPDPAQDVVSEAVSRVGIEIPGGKSAGHRKDGGHRKDNDKGKPSDEAPADETPGDGAEGMSGIVRGIKDARSPESGPMGQEVCTFASDNKCQSGTDHKGEGEGDGDKTNAPGTDAENKGRGDENNGDHGKPEDAPAKPETPAGSIATARESSGRTLPSGAKPE